MSVDYTAFTNKLKEEYLMSYLRSWKSLPIGKIKQQETVYTNLTATPITSTKQPIGTENTVVKQDKCL